MPELVVGSSVEPGQRLPLLQQCPEAVHAASPVVAGGEFFGLEDEPLLGLARLLSLPGPRCLPLRPMLGDDGYQRVQPPHQAVQITDGVRLADRRAHRLDRGEGVLWGHRLGGDPGLQE